MQETSRLTPYPMGKKAQNEVKIFIYVKTSAFAEPGDNGNTCLPGINSSRSEYLSSPSSCPLYLPLLS